MKKYRLARGGKSKKENVRFRELLCIQIKIIENYFRNPLTKGRRSAIIAYVVKNNPIISIGGIQNVHIYG